MEGGGGLFPALCMPLAPEVPCTLVCVYACGKGVLYTVIRYAVLIVLSVDGSSRMGVESTVKMGVESTVKMDSNQQ